MVKKIKKYLALLILLFAILIFYVPFLIHSRLPIPSDALVGLYHPYRDFYSQNYPNGIPFKNFLITDPVRQTYIWKELAVDMFKAGSVPLWNPYEMTGKPLMANFQSGALYPLNLVFLFLPFSLSWSILILLQTLLFGSFMFLYLRNLRINKYASLLGSLSVAFSGFSVAWLEWGNIVSTALWLPLVLFGIDKITQNKIGTKHIYWYMILSSALICSLFAGHLQSFFYLYIFSAAYFCLRWFENKNGRILIGFIISNLLVFVFSSIQWFPTLRFLLLSNRVADQNFSTIEGWFVPWKHLIQFIVPDFFGNPSTLNYWGTWNYGELVGYIGVLPIVFTFFSFYKRTKAVLFYLIVAIACLVMALPTGLSSIPFALNIPFISTAQPTRLLFPIIFSLSVLSAIGMDRFLGFEKMKLKQFLPFIIVGAMYALLLILIFTNSGLLFQNQTESIVARRNIIFPLFVFFASSIFLFIFVKIRNAKLRTIVLSIVVLVSFVDLLRFAQKFTPFTSQEYLYPTTKTLSFLQSKNDLFRVAIMDKRVMPPNFLTHYKLQTIEGYDPLYLKNYAEYVAAMESNQSDIHGPFGFNRIITPHNYNSQLFDFLNTKYIISLDEMKSEKLVKVFEEGQTKVYENKKAQPRIFFVENVVPDTKDMTSLFSNDLSKTAVVNGFTTSRKLSIGTVSDITYQPSFVSMKTRNNGDGYLVFSDAYYPTWSAYIDGVKTAIFITNHAFRGIFVPKGSHTVQFKDSLF